MKDFKIHRYEAKKRPRTYMSRALIKAKARAQKKCDPYYVVSLSDVHVPKHDTAAWAAVISFIDEVKPAFIVYNGDFLEFEKLGRWEKDPTKRQTLQSDLDAAVEMLHAVKALAPKAHHIWIDGNHEDRLRKFLWENPQLSDLRSLQMTELLQLDKLGIDYLPYNHAALIGDCLFHHGFYTCQNAGLQYMRKLCPGYSSVSGHSHRLNCMPQNSLDRTTWGVEQGHMCDPSQMDYIKVAPNWQTGFAIAGMYDGQVIPRPVPIVGGVPLI